MQTRVLLLGRAFTPALAALAVLWAGASAQLPEGTRIGAAGWMQYSVIGNSSDTAGQYSSYRPGAFDGKSVLSPGAQIDMAMDPSQNLHLMAGLGVAGGNNLPAGSGVKGGYAVFGFGAYVSNAFFKYQFKNATDSKISLTGGLFPYDYNPDVKNLGLYLLRGPVYPGVLISGFETKHTLPVANMLGLQLHHQQGGFQQDIILSSETEYYPYFDLSPAYVASYQFPLLRIGAGVNFYHLIPVDGDLTSGKHGDAPYSQWNYIDTAGVGGGGKPDTTNLGYAGTKVMVNASFDPKPLFAGAKWLGPEDLKLYTEVALIGLNNDKAHEAIYGDVLHRMPVMVGFNIPTCQFLEHLSIEVEWYGSKNDDNLDGYNIVAAPQQPYPTNWYPSGGLHVRARTNTDDNWKWSLHGARMIQKHVQLSFQIADDHYRPGIFDGYADSTPPHREAVLVTPKDWYFTTKLAYFF